MARGDLFILTDDDVEPAADWLVQWEAAAARYPQLSLFGGAIEPKFEVPPANEVVADIFVLAAAYGRTQAERPDGPLIGDPGDDFYGANIALRRAVVEAGLLFGVSGDYFPEDSDFARRAAAMGFQIGFAALARLNHMVPKSHLTPRWLANRLYMTGRRGAALDARCGTTESCARILGMRRYALRLFVTNLVKTTLRWPVMTSGARMVALSRLSHQAGRLQEEFVSRSADPRS